MTVRGREFRYICPISLWMDAINTLLFHLIQYPSRIQEIRLFNIKVYKKSHISGRYYLRYLEYILPSGIPVILFLSICRTTLLSDVNSGQEAKLEYEK